VSGDETGQLRQDTCDLALLFGFERAQPVVGLDRRQRLHKYRGARCRLVEHDAGKLGRVLAAHGDDVAAGADRHDGLRQQLAVLGARNDRPAALAHALAELSMRAPNRGELAGCAVVDLAVGVDAAIDRCEHWVDRLPPANRGAERAFAPLDPHGSDCRAQLVFRIGQAPHIESGERRAFDRLLDERSRVDRAAERQVTVAVEICHRVLDQHQLAMRPGAVPKPRPQTRGGEPPGLAGGQTADLVDNRAEFKRAQRAGVHLAGTLHVSAAVRETPLARGRCSLCPDSPSSLGRSRTPRPWTCPPGTIRPTRRSQR
jgi:hypothetical protein